MNVKPVPTHEVIPFQMQEFALVFVKLLGVSLSPFSQSVDVSPAHFISFGDRHAFAKTVFNPLVNFINRYIEQY